MATTIEQAREGLKSARFLRDELDKLTFEEGQFYNFMRQLDALVIDKGEFVALLDTLCDDFQYISEDHK